MYTSVKCCRICGNPHLVDVLDLGIQALTGVFPKSPDESISEGPLQLVKCHSRDTQDVCGLLQLKHSYRLDELYGDNYGYRSGLNRSMVNHLGDIVEKLKRVVVLEKGDLILDIGSNDGTLLGFYPANEFELVGMDPTARKFREYYRPDIKVVEDFFSAREFRKFFPGKRAKVVTSMSMFYDLESPVDFVKSIHDILHDEGIWVFEQSYMPLMIERNAYDTVCHEHLEYYGLTQVKWILDKVGFKIVDLELNDTNGGSFRLTVAKTHSAYDENTDLVTDILRQERKAGIGELDLYRQFAKMTQTHRTELMAWVQGLKASGKSLMGYGASTKGNVILQYCGFTSADIECIAEVNQDKFGRFTPGSRIPIRSESSVKALHPDYLLVLPWHFRDFIIERERSYLEQGGHLVFPLPRLDIVNP